MNKLLTELMAMLEALRLLHHTCHLNAKGDDFFGTHKMFEQLYGGLVDEFDSIGEHVVRLGGEPCPCDISKGTCQWLDRWKKDDCIQAALTAEKALQTALAALVKKNADSDIGLDNTLRGMADKHGTAVYFLQQTSKDDEE